MNGLIMMIIAIIVLVGAYVIYGRYLANLWGIDENAKTPAYELEDGVDYVPADTNVVFGHQFASIAGADFDGTNGCLPDGIAGCEELYKLFDRLLRLNYTDEQVKKISHANFERLFKQG